MSKREKAPAEPSAKIRPRHEYLGLEAGKAGYRRGCKCDPCRAWNRDRMRAYRAAKKPVEDKPEVIELPATIEAPAERILLKDLEPGDISAALAEDLPAADGQYVFQRTVSAIARQAALVLDNADKIDRLDLISTMQIRILDALKRLEPPRGPNVPGSQSLTAEQIIAAIVGDDGGTGEGD